MALGSTLSRSLGLSSFPSSQPSSLSSKMTHGGEFWLAYQFASRGNVAPTSQLIDLEFPGHKLIDLEDVLEYGMSLFLAILQCMNNVY